MPAIWAGFESGQPFGHDLLKATDHVPQRRMTEHYATAARLGCSGARDGIPPGHNPGARVRAARKAGFSPFFDAIHFHSPDGVMDRVRAAACVGATRFCPVNEPSVWSMFGGPDRAGAVDWWIRIAEEVRRLVPGNELLACDPVHANEGHEYGALDALAPHADVIGINHYPEWARVPLSDILAAASAKYPGKRLIIAETSWHDGHHEQFFPPFRCKADWLGYIMDSIAVSGVPVEAVCWYPAVDCPPWGDPAGERWSHGLIRADGSVDPSLSGALLEAERVAA